MRERIVKNLSHLHQFIVTHYDVEELRTLCFDLGVKYDDLGGEGLSAKARELILWLGRRGEIDALLTALQRSRSEIFEQAELSTDSGAMQVLYADLPAFEASLKLSWGTLWSRVLTFVSQHRLILLGTLVADGILISMYWCLRDLYLIGSFAGIGAIALATAAILGWYILLSQRPRSVWTRIFTLGATLLFVGGLLWQAKQIILPTQFPSQTFGIAVARFGEGESFHVAPLSRDVTDQIIRGLKDTIRGDPDWDMVDVMPVGLVTNEDQAREWGHRVQADLVVWGQVTVLRESNVSVHFEIIQTLDRVSSPAFPVVLPAETGFARTSTAVDAPLQPRGIKQLVSQQSRVITAFGLGLAAYFNRDYATAVKQFRSVAEAIESETSSSSSSQDKERGLAYFYLGRSYQLLGLLEAGEEWLWEADEFRPEDPAIRLGIAYGYDSMGREDEAERLGRDVLKLATDWLQLHPSDVAVAYDRGLAYQLLGEPQLAAHEFEDILREEPKFHVAYLSAGAAYLEMGKIEQAIGLFRTGIQQAEHRGGDSSWGYLYLAEAHNMAGEFEQAESFYQHAVKMAPNVDWMYFLQGKFYESQGRFDAAQQAYEGMIEVTNDEAWAHGEMAKFLRRQSRLEDAIGEFEIVRRERFYDTLSQVFLAELYLETGQIELASKTYEEVLRQAPELAYAHASYGRALVQWGDYVAAVSHFETALELDPSDGLTRFNLGRTLEANKQPQKALGEYQAILDAPSGQFPAEIRQWAEERIAVLLTATATPSPTGVPIHPPEPTTTMEAPLTPTPTPTSCAQPTDTLPPIPTPTNTRRPAPTNTPLPPPTNTRCPQPTDTLLPIPAPTRTAPPRPPTPIPP